MYTLEEKLREISGSDLYPFHMPGHKRQLPPEGVSCEADAAALFDLTEIDGLDNLHDPQEILRREMQFAASFYKTKDTFFSVNGSTCAILAAISASVPRGGTILIERRCHISVYHAAYLRGLKIRYLHTPEDYETIPSGVSAAVITSPTYEGEVKDVRHFAERVHGAGAVLIVDEAHGAHFSMHPYFPESSVRCGADLVIQSMHKTLPVLTQAALLHNVSGRVPDGQLQRFLDIYETSSPSYVLLLSMTRCLHAIAEKGAGYFDDYAERLRALRHGLAEDLHILELAGTEEQVTRGLYDPGKLVIRTPQGYTGDMLYRQLRTKYRLQPEMKGPDYVLLMTSVADTEEGFDRLRKALTEIDRDLAASAHTGLAAEDTGSFAAQGEPAASPSGGFISCIPETAVLLAEAADAVREYVPLSKAEGRIAAEYVIVYPPDAPVIIPGEIYSREILSALRKIQDAGLTVTGLSRCGDGAEDGEWMAAVLPQEA